MTPGGGVSARSVALDFLRLKFEDEAFWVQRFLDPVPLGFELSCSAAPA